VNSAEKSIRNTMIGLTDYLETSKSGYPLPPGSVQSFKKIKRDINALLLTDFNEDFKTDFYSSRFDENSDSNRITPDFADKLANSASGLAKTILKQSTNMVNAELTSVSVPPSRVLKLADCFQSNNTCEDFLRALPLNAFVKFKNVTQMLADPTSQRMFEKLNNRYVGTLGSADAIYQNMFKQMQSNSVITVFVLHLLVKIFGEKKGEINVNNYDLENQTSIEKLRTDTEVMCQRLENDFSVDNFTMYDVIDNKILCYHSTSLVKKSVSPAFEPKEFGGWRLSKEAGTLGYSTYTESVWSEDGFSLRFFFLYENGFFSSVVLIGGAVLTATAGYLNSWVNKNSDLLFAN